MFFKWTFHPPIKLNKVDENILNFNYIKIIIYYLVFFPNKICCFSSLFFSFSIIFNWNFSIVRSKYCIASFCFTLHKLIVKGELILDNSFLMVTSSIIFSYSSFSKIIVFSTALFKILFGLLFLKSIKSLFSFFSKIPLELKADFITLKGFPFKIHKF